jgi:putative Holliday junction resolvase
MSILLGIDFGDKRIGLALSDPEEKLARRFLTLSSGADTLARIKSILKENSVGKIIVGLPVGFRGASEQTRKVEEFIALLRRETDVPLKTMNEILTSKMAEDNLIRTGTRDIKAVLDQEAARIILQDYMNLKNEYGKD